MRLCLLLFGLLAAGCAKTHLNTYVDSQGEFVTEVICSSAAVHKCTKRAGMVCRDTNPSFVPIGEKRICDGGRCTITFKCGKGGPADPPEPSEAKVDDELGSHGVSEPG